MLMAQMLTPCFAGGRRRRSTLKPSGHCLRVLQSRFLRPAPNPQKFSIIHKFPSVVQPLKAKW